METKNNLKDIKNQSTENRKESLKVPVPDIDFSNFYALLIGVSKYPKDKHLHSIPNVEVNLTVLKNLLTDKDIMGVPKKNIIIAKNESKLNIEKKIRYLTKIATSETDTLFIYYSGHGIISPNTFQLYFATADTCSEYLEQSSIESNYLKEIIKFSNAKRKIIIIDSCHSGKIHNTLDNINSAMAALLDNSEGIYILTSSGEDKPSYFPPNSKEPTYFTAKFVEVIRNGIKNNKPYLTLRDIYHEIKKDFARKRLPLPYQSVYKNMDELIFAKNKQYKKDYITYSTLEIIRDNITRLKNFDYSNIEELHKKFIKIKKANKRKLYGYTILITLFFIIFGVILSNIILNNKKLKNYSIQNIYNDTIAVKYEDINRYGLKPPPKTLTTKICQKDIQEANQIVKHKETGKFATALKIYLEVQKKCKIRSKYADTLAKWYIKNAKQFMKLKNKFNYQMAYKYLQNAYALTGNDSIEPLIKTVKKELEKL